MTAIFDQIWQIANFDAGALLLFLIFHQLMCDESFGSFDF